MLLTTLWVIGITAEGMTGALAAGRERMDMFGVIMVAFVTALGGGSIRDVILGNYPLIWVAHPEYVVVIVLAAIVTVSIAQLMKYFRPMFLLLDAVGLVVFSILGSKIALSADHGIVIAVVAAVVTGVAGGIIRDLLCNRIPLVFREELYASISVLIALLYVGIDALGVVEHITVVICLVVGLSLRLLALKFKLRLPVFDYQESYYDNRKALRGVVQRMRNWRFPRPTRHAVDDDA